MVMVGTNDSSLQVDSWPSVGRLGGVLHSSDAVGELRSLAINNNGT